MPFINATEAIGVIVQSGTETVTGSIIATLFLILLFLIILCVMFSIPLEFAAIILLPFCISVAAYYSSFLLAVTLIAIYLSALVAQHFIFK